MLRETKRDRDQLRKQTFPNSPKHTYAYLSSQKIRARKQVDSGEPKHHFRLTSALVRFRHIVIEPENSFLNLGACGRGLFNAAGTFVRKEPTAPRRKHKACPREMLIRFVRWKTGYVQLLERTCSTSTRDSRKNFLPPHTTPSLPPSPPHSTPRFAPLQHASVLLALNFERKPFN